MNARTLKLTTGKLLAMAVALHAKAIHFHLDRVHVKTLAATAARKRAHDDLKMAQRVFSAADGAEGDAHAEYHAAMQAAKADLAALPSVQGYGAIRTSPPFGAQPQVIDKRSK